MTRTFDPLHPMQVRYQLRHAPLFRAANIQNFYDY